MCTIVRTHMRYGYEPRIAIAVIFAPVIVSLAIIGHVGADLKTIFGSMWSGLMSPNAVFNRNKKKENRASSKSHADKSEWNFYFNFQFIFWSFVRLPYLRLIKLCKRRNRIVLLHYIWFLHACFSVGVVSIFVETVSIQFMQRSGFIFLLQSLWREHKFTLHQVERGCMRL